MAKSIWRYLADLPPIDWAYLASQRKPFGKGSKKTPEQIAKVWRARRARQILRRRAAIERIRHQQVAARKQGREQNITARMLSAMEPGHWYGRSDVWKLSGVKKDSVKMQMSRLVRWGFVERAPNPDYEIRLTPQFLYRLTAAGELERERTAYAI